MILNEKTLKINNRINKINGLEGNPLWDWWAGSLAGLARLATGLISWLADWLAGWLSGALWRAVERYREV